jgi:hypothetical protein
MSRTPARFLVYSQPPAHQAGQKKWPASTQRERRSCERCRRRRVLQPVTVRQRPGPLSDGCSRSRRSPPWAGQRWPEARRTRRRPAGCSAARPVTVQDTTHQRHHPTRGIPLARRRAQAARPGTCSRPHRCTTAKARAPPLPRVPGTIPRMHRQAARRRAGRAVRRPPHRPATPARRPRRFRATQPERIPCTPRRPEVNSERRRSPHAQLVVSRRFTVGTQRIFPTYRVPSSRQRSRRLLVTRKTTSGLGQGTGATFAST